MSILASIRVFVWGRPASTKAERHLIVKIDFFVLSYCCLMYWVNYLDRANLNNAYVSGMQQDLRFKGTQLNQINTLFYAGYLIGQVPNNLVMQRIPPRIWMPLTCFGWGLLTLGTGFTHHPWQIMVIRFFQGIIEASSFVGTHWILGSWYKEEELGKRTAIFTSSGLAGTLFSGVLQGGIYSSLNGRNGLAGWRWLFIIDFLITLPIAAYGYLCFPDTPDSTKARYLSDEEKEMAIRRLPQATKQRGVLGWSLLRRVLLSWQWWLFVLLWIASSNTEMYSSNALMNIWLKGTGDYPIEQVDYLPTTVSAFGIICTLLIGWYSDSAPNSGRRWHAGIVLAITAIISGSVMLGSHATAAKFFAFILNGAQFAGQAVFFAWANDMTRDDDAMRSVTLASMNMFSIAIYLWWSLVLYNVSQAPNWTAGSIAMICMGVALAACTIATYLLQRKQQRKDRLRSERSPDGTEVGAEDLEKTSAQMSMKAGV